MGPETCPPRKTGLVRGLTKDEYEVLGRVYTSTPTLDLDRGGSWVQTEEDLRSREREAYRTRNDVSPCVSGTGTRPEGIG